MHIAESVVNVDDFTSVSQIVTDYSSGVKKREMTLQITDYEWHIK